MTDFKSAKYLYDMEGNKTHIRLNLGNNRYKHILLNTNSEVLKEVLEWSKVEGNKIEEAD